MAGILYCAGLQSDHFTHVFIDEVNMSLRLYKYI